MSGHSKWSTIKRDKAVNDAKRSQAFTKVARLITVASRQGGGDPDSNPALRLAMEKAKKVRMPKENVTRAIQKGTGKGAAGSSLSEVAYEGFGTAGAAFYVKAITDNTNRTVAEIRNIFSTSGGSLGASGGTAYIFQPDPAAPTFTVAVSAADYTKLESLRAKLLDNDDVQDVFHNYVQS
jgi:YebC/PmpR family DNA-binding regulatory protein